MASACLESTAATLKAASPAVSVELSSVLLQLPGALQRAFLADELD